MNRIEELKSLASKLELGLFYKDKKIKISVFDSKIESYVIDKEDTYLLVLYIDSEDETRNIDYTNEKVYEYIRDRFLYRLEVEGRERVRRQERIEKERKERLERLQEVLREF